MNRTKTMLVMAAAVAVGAASLGLWGWLSVQDITKALTEARRQTAEMRDAVAALERKLPEMAKRVGAVENDNAALASALRQTDAAVKNAEGGSISREAFAERAKRAMELSRAGDSDEAVRELLWCYRTAIARPGLGMGPVGQPSYFVGALARFSEGRPEVRTELLKRFEAGKWRVIAGDDDMEPLGEMGSIARALKDERLMVAVWDAIPAGDPRRQPVGSYATAGLIAEKRYVEALSGTSYGMISSQFESNSSRNSSKGAGDPGVSYLIKTTAKNIELLAGAGDLAHARELAGRLLTYDGTEATRALLQKHLERAGQPGLLQAAGK